MQATQQHVSLHYLEEQLSGLTPVQLVVRIFDAALVGCEKQDRERVSRALVELISALNFEQNRDVAVRLFQLYNFCLRQSKIGRLDVVKPILSDLRDTWTQVAKEVDKTPAP